MVAEVRQIALELKTVWIGYGPSGALPRTSPCCQIGSLRLEVGGAAGATERQAPLRAATAAAWPALVDRAADEVAPTLLPRGA
jgi:hypothetical protein